LQRYAENEEAKIMDTVKQSMGNDKLQEYDTLIYESSLSLFINIKKSIERCTSFSNTKALYDLSNCFKNIF